ncbi:hypothetical protein BMETH_1147_1 [methanotrophic bacterial endosymbiont of Bathymodiolus sp.]|nr:hypothetical protein BMETH_1147_1 [methanotrophic bacterial endosymbiont of Bathymodiolus sp.]
MAISFKALISADFIPEFTLLRASKRFISLARTLSISALA